MEDFFLDISYKNKTVRFKVVNPEAPLSTLMDNLRHAIGGLFLRKGRSSGA